MVSASAAPVPTPPRPEPKRLAPPAQSQRDGDGLDCPPVVKPSVPVPSSRSSCSRSVLLLGLPALLVTSSPVGCQSSRSRSSDVKESAGGGIELVPDERGRVDKSTTGATGIQGRWFVDVDTVNYCQKRGKHLPADCSVLITPDPQLGHFAPTGKLGMCAVGVAAKVILRAGGNPDWENIWGAQVGLTLNDDRPYDAVAHGVTGFAFHLDSEPAPGAGLRVQLLTAALANNGVGPLWGGASGDTSPAHAGHNEFRWADVGGPPYVDQPPRFDPTGIVAVAFQMPASATGARSFSFCISQVTALMN
jgi:hypothetical protein